jgi:MraZ protein
MFRGRYCHNTDSKGRVSVPARFREILSAHYEEVLVITNFDRCLVAFPLQEWAAIEERTKELSMLQKDARAFIRYFYSGAMECRLDRQGRVLIPPSLRDFAKIEKEVMLVGAANRIELWSKEVWEEFIQQSEENFEEIAARLSDFGL